MGRLVA